MEPAPLSSLLAVLARASAALSRAGAVSAARAVGQDEVFLVLSAGGARMSFLFSGAVRLGLAPSRGGIPREFRWGLAGGWAEQGSGTGSPLPFPHPFLWSSAEWGLLSRAAGGDAEALDDALPAPAQDAVRLCGRAAGCLDGSALVVGFRDFSSEFSGAEVSFPVPGGGDGLFEVHPDLSCHLFLVSRLGEHGYSWPGPRGACPEAPGDVEAHPSTWGEEGWAGLAWLVRAHGPGDG